MRTPFQNAMRLAVAWMCCLTVSLFAQPALAQSSGSLPMMTGQIVRDAARITFFWPEQVDFQAKRAGNQLMVRFDRTVNPDFGVILASLYPYVTKAELTGDRHTVIFTLQKPFDFRAFKNVTESGIELLAVREMPEGAAPAPIPPKSADPQISLTASAKPVIAKPLAEKPALPIPAPIPVAAPVAKAPEKAAPAHHSEEQPAQHSAPALPTKPFALETAPKATPAPVVKVESITPPSLTHTAKKEQWKPKPYKPLLANQPQKRIVGDEMTVGFLRVNGEPRFIFPFKKRSAAAAWLQDQELWILLNEPRTLKGLEDLPASAATWISNVEQLGGEAYTLLRVSLRKPAALHVEKPKGSYSWQIGLTEFEQPHTQTITPRIDRGASPKIFFPAAENEGVYTLTHPETGMPIYVVALYAEDQGVDESLSFPQVAIMPSRQGVVLTPFSDTLSVTRDKQGVTVTAQDGLTLSRTLPQPKLLPTKEEQKRANFKTTLFPDEKWRAKSDDRFMATLNHLLGQLEDETGEEKQDRRVQIAGLYLSAGMGPEALGVLSRIREENLDYYREKKLAALEGAAYLLSYRTPQAELALSTDALDGDAEGALLRAAVAAEFDPAQAPRVPYIQNNNAFIRQYPLELRQHLAIIAANQSITQRDFNAARSILKSLEEDDAQKGIEPYIHFMQARLDAESGQFPKAKKVLDGLIDNVEDRQFRARALYYLTLKQLEQRAVTPEDALKTLDKVRIIWRGDDLERAVLMLIGQLNVSLGNYWDGLKSWEDLMQNYPNTPDALEAYARMSETFRRLFLENAAKNMQPIKALALYNEFQELTPIGDDGDRMIENLVDRLVSVDLLDEAAARLERQIKYRLKGETKSLIGARLALLQLLNQDPTKALVALQNTRIDNAPSELSLQRNRLAAQALLELERPAQALTMIDGDLSHAADSLRMDAYWQQEDWANLVDAIELEFSDRKNPREPLNEAEAQRLLQLALAYTFMGEYDQMAYLRRTFGPLMEESPYKEEFFFLAQDRAPVDYKNLQKNVESISKIKGFMDEFRGKLRSQPFSQAITK